MLILGDCFEKRTLPYYCNWKTILTYVSVLKKNVTASWERPQTPQAERSSGGGVPALHRLLAVLLITEGNGAEHEETLWDQDSVFRAVGRALHFWGITEMSENRSQDLDLRLARVVW